MAAKILPGYPSAFGNKRVVCVDVTGPAAYVKATGQVIKAADYGLKAIESIDSSLDSTKAFFTVPESGSNGQPTPTLGVHWYNVAGGEKNDNDNLSGSRIRLFITGVS